MEDSHSVHLFLPPADETPSSSSTQSPPIPEQPAGSTVTNEHIDANGPALFGVFDGHGGSNVAKYTGTTFHTRLAALEAYSASPRHHQMFFPLTGVRRWTVPDTAEKKDYEEALKIAYVKTDQDLRAGQSIRIVGGKPDFQIPHSSPSLQDVPQWSGW